MHLDTIFTRISNDEVLIFPPILEQDFEPYVVDIYIPDLLLGLEIDGLIKSEQELAQEGQQMQAQAEQQQQDAARMEAEIYESKAIIDVMIFVIEAG